jgi:hypothetical protein
VTIASPPPPDVDTSAGVPSSEDLDLRAFVTLRRDHPNDAQQRQVIVRVDDGPTATLMFGDRLTVEVQPGRHVLRANNTLFWKRASFSIEAGEHIEFVLVNRAGRLMLGLLATIGVAPLYLDIERRSVR